MTRHSTWLASALALALAAAAHAVTPAPAAKAAAAPKTTTAAVRELDWDALLPKDAVGKFQGGPPPPAHDYLGGESGMAAQQVLDFSVNKELDGASVKIPGFIVPLEIDDEGRVTELFLVPFFGACIHVPPPAPNQIVYVILAQPLELGSMADAYWITGRMHATNRKTRLGASAYEMTDARTERYEF